MNLENYKIGFIGFGQMAQILFQRLISSALIQRDQILFTDKQQKIEKISKKYAIESASIPKIKKDCHIILICTPPQNIKEVLDEFKKGSFNDRLYISIMAGIKIERIQKELGKNLMIMRALPNVASSIGEGVTPLCFNSACSLDMKTVGMLLFTALGIVVEIPEKLMDVVCGICGCLPAFVFKMIDEIAKLGFSEGLNYDMALKLTAHAFAGSAKLIQKEKKVDSLINSVCSPGGAAEVGLKAMEKLNILSDLKEIVRLSINRSKELSNI